MPESVEQINDNDFLNQLNLKTAIIGQKIIFYPEIDSTNIQAKAIANQGTAEGTVIIADYQTQGQGRLKRKWISPPGKNLLFSIILSPPISVEEAFSMTLLTSLAVCKSLIQLFVLNAKIKWPNDIYINQRKICGILTEASTVQKKLNWIVIGVGLNVNVDFSGNQELKEIATSIKMETGNIQNRKLIFCQILEEMDRLYQSFLAGNFNLIKEEWLKYSLILGKTVRVFSNNFEETGVAETIDETGALILLTPEGERKKIIAGEVSLRIPEMESFLSE